jgi:hypothetical protein
MHLRLTSKSLLQLNMLNLQPYVDKVWSSTTLEEKRLALKNLVNASHATKKTKALTLLQINKASMTKLDSLAINYSLKGEGLGVL